MSEAVPSDLLRVARDLSKPDGSFNMHEVRSSFGNTKVAQFSAMIENLVDKGLIWRRSETWFLEE